MPPSRRLGPITAQLIRWGVGPQAGSGGTTLCDRPAIAYIPPNACPEAGDYRDMTASGSANFAVAFDDLCPIEKKWFILTDQKEPFCAKCTKLGFLVSYYTHHL